MGTRISILFFFFGYTLVAQFPGPVGTTGSTAMYKDSSTFVAWGKECLLTKGYQDLSNTSLGYVNVGDSSNAIGMADGSIVSLGDGGVAIITFTTPIKNGTGYDFAVFENSFNDTFLELAFVEVSSDGINYYRFPPTSNSQNTVQYDNSAAMDAAKLDNLAGKYRGFYGTPFDLQELSGIPQLNVNAITHVKIIDVIGSINSLYATYDKNNNVINDPWPTPFGSSGFDLDAVGVIHQSAVGIEELEKSDLIAIYPNPCRGSIQVKSATEISKIQIINPFGEIVINETAAIQYASFNIENLSSGIYFVCIETKKGRSITKLIKE